MSVCPNKNSAEWKALAADPTEGGVGTFEAYRDFLENKEIRSPEIVQAKIDAKTSSTVFQLQREESDGTPTSIEVLKNVLEPLAKKFGPDYGYRIDENIEDGFWKGRVEPASQYNGNKPTIVINAKLATLDTPLHEFGHIFLNLIKSENIALYTQLRSQIKSNKEYVTTLNEIKAKYSERFPDMKDWEFEDEAIVELMGRFAANDIDPKTGLYKVMSDLWEAIKEAFRKIKQISQTYREGVLEGTEDSEIKVLDLSSNASIEVLAKLLAMPDVKITAAASQKEIAKRVLEEYTNTLSTIKSEHEKTKSLLASSESGKYKSYVGTRSSSIEENLRKWAPRNTTVNRMLVFDEKTSKQITSLTNNGREFLDYVISNQITYDVKGKSLERDLGSFIEIIANDISRGYTSTEGLSFDPNAVTEKDVIAIKNKILKDYNFKKLAFFIRDLTEQEKADGFQNILNSEVLGVIRSIAENPSARNNVDKAAHVVAGHGLHQVRDGIEEYFSRHVENYRPGNAANYAGRMFQDIATGNNGYYDKSKYIKHLFSYAKILSTSYVAGTYNELDTLDSNMARTGTIQDKNNIIKFLDKSVSIVEEKLQNMQTGGVRDNSEAFTKKKFTYRFNKQQKEMFSVDPAIDVDRSDEYTVKTSFDPVTGIISIDFESKQWIYSDPVYTQPIKSDLSNLPKPRNLQRLTPDELDQLKIYNNGLQSLRKSSRYKQASPLEKEGYINEFNEQHKDIIKRSKQYKPAYVTITEDPRKTKEGIITEILPDGNLKVHMFNRGGSDNYFAQSVPGSPNEYIVSSEDVLLVKDQTRSGVSTSVIEAVSTLYHDVDFKGLSFYPSGGSSIKGHRAAGEMRRENYNNWAKRLFRDNYAGMLNSGGNYVILVPEGYRQGLTVSRELYQLSDKTTNEVPVEAKDSLLGLATEQTTVDAVVDEAADSKVQAVELANKMSEALGIDYQIITAKDAEILTKDAKNPWNGESAFFIGSTVYFVGDNMNTNQVFHEFSHPLVRALSIDNTKLFNNLYEQIFSTPEGQALIEAIKENYPELDPNSNLFKEEVIVSALSEKGIYEQEEIKTNSKFNQVMRNVLYAIKQLMRKVFGKNSDVAKLNPNTSLKEVAEMLNKGDVINIDLESVTDEDVVAYMRNQKEYVDDLINIPNKELQALVNRVYDVSTRYINKLKQNKEYDELAAILTDENKMGDLDAIKSRVQEYQTMVSNLADNTIEDMEQVRKKTSALIDTVFRLDTVMEKVLLHMQDIREEGDTQDNLAKASYYKELVDYWEGFLKEMNEALNDNANMIPKDSPFLNLVSSIERSIKKVNNLVNDMYADGARDTLYQELEPMGRSMKTRYETLIADLEKREAPPKRIDQLHTEYYGLNRADYQRMKDLQKAKSLSMNETNELERLERTSAEGLAVTPEKIEKMLKGQIGDANFFNSYLEGYLYNTDPIIGGLALYVKNNMNTVMATAQSKFNNFAKDVKPLMTKAGYTNSRQIGKMGQDLGEIDVIATRDEDGKLIKTEVWSLLHTHKGHRYDQAVHKENVDKAQYKLIQEGSDEARAELANAIAERQTFLRRYFNQEYVPEYYERQRLFEQDDIGKEAMMLRKNLFERIRMLNEPATTQTDLMNIADETDDLWREYRQMHSEFYLNGQKKKDDDLAIAKRLKKYREESSKFYENKLRKGAFENAFRAYEQELTSAGITGDEFKVLRGEWIKRNTRTAIKSEWYDERQKKIDRITEIMKKLNDSDRKALDQSKVWEKIFDLTGVRDKDNQPDADKLDPAAIAEVKALQEELIKLNENYMQRNGLTPAENASMRELHELRTNGDPAFNAAEMTRLYDKQNNFGLNKWDIAELNGLYEELAGLSQKDATDQYVDAINYWLTELDTAALPKEYFGGVNKLTADGLLEPKILNKLLGQNDEFDKWFYDNHLQKEVWNKEKGEKEIQWERLYVWNVIRPADKNYMEEYTFKDSEGEQLTVAGLPSNNYYSRVVKPEYKTKEIVGVTVDNRGQWLPKTMAQKAFDDKYINKKYYKIQEENKPLFELLEKVKEHHLKNQEGLNYKSKLYLDYPRFKKSTLEVLQTKKLKDTVSEKSGFNALTIYAQRIRDFLKGDKEGESERNYRNDFNLVRADMFDNEITDVPIAGLYNTDLQDVSTDITHTMMRYMLSAERQKQLVKISPVAKAIQSVVNDPKNQIKEVDKINKFNFLNRGIKTYLSKKGKNVRQRAVNNFIEREFEGQSMTGATKDVAWLNNASNLMFKRASFGFFALNIPSALKNSYGAKFQGMIEASAGKYYNHAEFQKGNAWSYATMGELSFGGQLYNKGSKSHRQQLVDAFDPSQGRVEEKFGEGMSRSLLKDTASMSWLYNFRKWVELQATLQIFGGMMYHQKVKINEGTPEEKTIAYMDAWETIDGQIQLKKGVDPKWGITFNDAGEIQIGAEFSRKKNEIHQVMNNLQGAYSKFDQPEAQRYLAFRFLSYLRRYFTTMTMNRFGFSGKWSKPQPRLNVGAGDFQKGYYVEFLGTVKRAITSLGRDLAFMTPEEKRAALKVMSEVAMLVATNMLMGLLFGWDPDDDDKFAKLRERSGALPFLFAGDENEEFNTLGFMENHALFLLMNIRAENEQFLPLPGYGLDDYTAMLDLKSIAFGPTVKTYTQLFEDGINIISGSDKAYYKRRIGPYSFQQEGGSKFWAHFARTLGMTGSSLDPAKAIKGFQSVQARAR